MSWLSLSSASGCSSLMTPWLRRTSNSPLSSLQTLILTLDQLDLSPSVASGPTVSPARVPSASAMMTSVRRASGERNSVGNTASDGGSCGGKEKGGCLQHVILADGRRCSVRDNVVHVDDAPQLGAQGKQAVPRLILASLYTLFSFGVLGKYCWRTTDPQNDCISVGFRM